MRTQERHDQAVGWRVNADLFSDADKGAEAEQSEVNAAVTRSTKYFIPVLIFFFTVNIASALSLYWLISGLVAMLQQARVLKSDEDELETAMHKDDKKTVRKKVSSTARVVSVRTEGAEDKKPTTTQNSSKKSKNKKAKKRRR